jgi:16S rRNA (cytosine1402-N4)-methyltransferase
MQSKKRPHVSIMAGEMLTCFEGCSLKVFYEGTLGAGGHAHCLLEAHPEIEAYLGCDQDPDALKIARTYLEPWKDKVVFIHGNFGNLKEQLEERNIPGVDGFFLT